MNAQSSVDAGANAYDLPHSYRPEIDGIRAIAVIAVILFHFGSLPQGYLGVDVFFVISGYLITEIIVRDWQAGRFSIGNFYMRRARRILPLAMCVTSLTLGLGALVMLPDDLENLAQSVVATNLFSNNILQAVTTKDYWDIVNDYKPLMHTWSLGVEEQYYFLYPLILLAIPKGRIHRFALALLAFSVASLIANLLPFPDFQKFYLLPFRIFELGGGGLAAILFKRKLSGRFAGAVLFLLVLLLSIPSGWLPTKASLLGVTSLTAVLLIMDMKSLTLAKQILRSDVMVGVGKISFSLYMWHQPYLAFSRYFVFEELGVQELTALTLLIGITSVVSYRYIEQPFRNPKRSSQGILLVVLSTLFLTSTATAMSIYLRSGIIRDVPELGLRAGDAQRGVHAAFNHRIRELDRDFQLDDKIHVLVLGDSFARDWANVLLASRYASKIEISYMHNYERDRTKLAQRAPKADIVFVTTPPKNILSLLNIPAERVYAVGNKRFGESNGYFYNRKGEDYLSQRARTPKRLLEDNRVAQTHWGVRYMDYFAGILDEDGRVPVFTPTGKFISQDCRHLTTFGAQFFAQLFDQRLQAAFDRLAERAPGGPERRF